MNETVTTSQAQAAPAGAKSGAARAPLRWGRILVWAGIVALLALLGWGLLNANATRPEAGAEAPDFEMQYFQDYEWQDMPAASLGDMKGNVVVLNFWASWCVECRLEAELLENAWRQYGDQGVVFLGVAYVDSEAKSLAYLDEFNITYPNAPDLGSVISERYEITGVPETFFIDRNGTVSRVVIGPVNSTTLHNEIAQLLAQ